MTRIAPKPENFRALADAWNDPYAFAREQQVYYTQLARERANGIPPHWTERNRDDESD